MAQNSKTLPQTRKMMFQNSSPLSRPTETLLCHYTGKN